MTTAHTRQGSVLGGTLLVAGCCIGAGMLALPILTGLCGFFPSLLLLFLAWGYMTYSGLLLVEVNTAFPGKVNLLTMTRHYLGPWGRRVCWISYLFLFYALLVAYTAASGSILSAVFKDLFHLDVPYFVSSLLFALGFGGIVYLGTRPVDLINRLLVALLVIAYVSLIGLGLSKVQPSHLMHADWRYLLLPLPVLVISFGFQNMVPSLSAYLGGDVKRIRQTIFGGSLITFAIYLIWSVFFLGTISPETIGATFVSGEEAAGALRSAIGSSSVSAFATAFSFFAIVTSFLAQGLSLVHFISDGWKISYKKRENFWVTLLAIVPPTLFAIVYPQVFLKALSFAGGICAVVLFGFLPVLMVIVHRKTMRAPSYAVKGGKFLLGLAFAFSLLILLCEVSRLLNLSFMQYE